MSLKQLRWAFRLSQWEPCSSQTLDVNQWTSILSYIQPEEVERANAFYFREDSKCAVIGRLMLRRAIVEMSDLHWKDISLSRTDKGKPILVDKNNQVYPETFSFNISHHGDFVVLACEPGTISKCGVDVMKIQFPGYKTSVNEYLNLMKKKFSPREFQSFDQCLSDDQKLALFYRYWCLKESYIKALGQSIYARLDSLDFEIKTWVLSRELVCCDTALHLDENYQQNLHFEESLLDDNHIATVCRTMAPDREDEISGVPFQQVDLPFLLQKAEAVCHNLKDAQLNAYFQKEFKTAKMKA